MRKIAKLPDRPVAPMTKVLVPYLRFSQHVWREYKEKQASKEGLKGTEFEQTDLTVTKTVHMSKLIAERWKSLDAAGRAPFVDTHERESRAYNKVMAKWKETEKLPYDLAFKQALKQQAIYDAEYEVALSKYNLYTNAQQKEQDEEREMTNSFAEPAFHSSGANMTVPPDGGNGAARVLYRARVEASRQIGEVGGLQTPQQKQYVQHKVARNRYLRNNCFMEEIFVRDVSAHLGGNK